MRVISALGTGEGTCSPAMPGPNSPERLTRFVEELRRTTLELEQKIANCPSDLTITEAFLSD